MPTLDERYRAVHDAILAGPNRELQEWVDSGTVWLLEGHAGRTAMAAFEAGALVLGPEPCKDYWGNDVPSYRDVEDAVGSKGSVANAENYDPEEQ